MTRLGKVFYGPYWESVESPTLGELVAVLWLDACGDDDGGWHPPGPGSPYEPARCISAGRLLQYDENVVALAPHWTLESDDGNPLEGGRVVIPTGCVMTMLSFVGAVDDLTKYRVTKDPGTDHGKTEEDRKHSQAQGEPETGV